MDCSYCGKPVNPTVHRHSGAPAYEVGYYRLLTGDLQLLTMQKPGEENEIIEFFKLLNPRWVAACRNCFADDRIQREMADLFSGVPEIPNGRAEGKQAGTIDR